MHNYATLYKTMYSNDPNSLSSLHFSTTKVYVKFHLDVISSILEKEEGMERRADGRREILYRYPSPIETLEN